MNHLLDLHLFCPHLSNIRRTVYTLFTRPSNSSSNTSRWNTLIDKHYTSWSFNSKMTLPYCAIRSSPTRIWPLKTPLPVLYLTLTRTQLHLPSHFPALVNQNFVLPRWALWDHPERKQTILQTPIFSPHTKRRKLLQPRRRISHQESQLEKLFADEIATYASITAGINSQYFFLYDKIRQLEPGNSDAIIWKTPSVKFVFDSAKVARPSSDPLIEPAPSFSSPIFRTHHHGYNFFVKFYPYVIEPATGKSALILFTLFPGDYDNLFQWPFSKIIHIGIRDQLDPLNTWTKTIQPDQDPAYKKPTISTKTGVAAIIINNFIPHSKLFSETEGFLIDGTS